jgi:hypothetical protein
VDEPQRQVSADPAATGRTLLLIVGQDTGQDLTGATRRPKRDGYPNTNLRMKAVAHPDNYHPQAAEGARK